MLVNLEILKLILYFHFHNYFGFKSTSLSPSLLYFFISCFFSQRDCSLFIFTFITQRDCSLFTFFSLGACSLFTSTFFLQRDCSLFTFTFCFHRYCFLFTFFLREMTPRDCWPIGPGEGHWYGGGERLASYFFLLVLRCI